MVQANSTLWPLSWGHTRNCGKSPCFGATYPLESSFLMYQQSQQNILLLKLHRTDYLPFLYFSVHVHPYVISEMEKGVALAALSSPLMS